MNTWYARLGFVALVMTGLSACQAPNVPVYGERTDNTALARISGELELQDGCLVLVSPDSLYLVTWPPGTTWDYETGTIELDGQQARVGAPVALGGGEFPAGPIDDESEWETPPTEECLSIGRVWRTSIILEPAS